MSEYQYYDFCTLNKPMTAEARQEMRSLSSRANLSTHGASYVYNYGNFRGNPEELLLKHFDVFFYIANWGTVQLMLRYPKSRLDLKAIKPYCIDDVIQYTEHSSFVLLDIQINSEEGFGWLEGEGMLGDFLSLYDEILAGDYRFLYLARLLAVELDVNVESSEIKKLLPPSNLQPLSLAQKAFLDIFELGSDWVIEKSSNLKETSMTG